MKKNDTYKITTDDGRVVCGLVTELGFTRFRINGETFLYCDLANIEKIEKYVKKTTGVASKIGIPR